MKFYDEFLIAFHLEMFCAAPLRINIPRWLLSLSVFLVKIQGNLREEVEDEDDEHENDDNNKEVDA